MDDFRNEIRENGFLRLVRSDKSSCLRNAVVSLLKRYRSSENSNGIGKIHSVHKISQKLWNDVTQLHPAREV